MSVPRKAAADRLQAAYVRVLWESMDKKNWGRTSRSKREENRTQEKAMIHAEDLPSQHADSMVCVPRSHAEILATGADEKGTSYA